MLKAEEQYEVVKDTLMSEGVNEDSYVQLVSSEDEFEECCVIKRADAVIDEERTELRTPREEGFDWDYWARWQEVTA